MSGFYRAAATLSARFLHVPPVAESIYAHRSVATGEISFGRSDIDLLMIVRQPRGDAADGPELASLYGRLCWLRRFNPALSHVEVHDPAGIRRWLELDTYRSSQERRSAMLLRGKPVCFPDVAVRREDAVRRLCVWTEGFFSTAVRERNRRNLRKTALEIWCAFATAMGRIPQPCLTRPEIAARWAESEDAPLLDPLLRDPSTAPSVVFRLAKRLHGSLLPPLRPVSQPLVAQLLMPPRYRQRILVVVPEENSSLPREAFQPGSCLCTPELLDLYLHYMNPFLVWSCPQQLTGLGVQPPSVAEFVRGCLFYGHNHTLRNPGFMYRHTWPPAVFIEVVRHALPYLHAGEIPPPLDPRRVAGWIAGSPSPCEYYRSVFPHVYRESEEQWIQLQELEERLRSS
ncbi:MAG TPA: hypothetical protein VLH09_07765 [Bryobacteraceae bacterium]|nr:hypothetical protein [Bryobacteraceae bacterium]